MGPQRRGVHFRGVNSATAIGQFMKRKSTGHPLPASRRQIPQSAEPSEGRNAHFNNSNQIPRQMLVIMATLMGGDPADFGPKRIVTAVDDRKSEGLSRGQFSSEV
jgi:hypothetical protein